MKDYTLHISTKSLINITLFALCVYIIVLIRHTLLLVFVALICATLIEPFAASLKKHHIPRALSALIVYITLFGIIGTSIAVLTPVVVRDLPQLFDNTGEYLNTIKNHETVQQIFGSDFASQGSFFFLHPGDGDTSGISNVFASISTVFGGVVSFVIVLVITFYLVIQDDPLRKVLHSLVPDDRLPFVLNLIDKIRHKLGMWMRGQLTLSLIMGIIIFLVLTALGIKYAAVIGLLGALLEFIPYLGPMLIAIPSVFFGYIQGGIVKFVLVGGALILIQQFENHILIPKVMQKAVGLNPVISIIALIIGIELGGILGGVLAIPVATTLQVIVEEIMEMKKNKL